MNSNQGHPKSFFKYMPASTAEIVLKNKTLRWRHPSLFDDTLDVARVCDEKMDKSKQKQIQEAMIDLATNPPTRYASKNTNKLFKCLSFLISLFGSNKNSAISELKRCPIDISNSMANLNKCWEEIRKEFRILCLGIEKDNNRLWSDYAEKHKGVVIEFNCNLKSDSPWLVAEPVEYVNEEDLFITAQEWAEILSLEEQEASMCLIKKCSLKKVKSRWAEQNEWRIPSFCRCHETGLESDYGVNPNDFSAVYFGYKMDIVSQNNLLSLLNGELSHVSAFRCELDSKQNITYKKIK